MAKLSFDITMNCRELELLVIDGKADYVIHLERSTAAYREVLHSVSKHIEHVIPIVLFVEIHPLSENIICKKINLMW